MIGHEKTTVPDMAPGITSPIPYDSLLHSMTRERLLIELQRWQQLYYQSQQEIRELERRLYTGDVCRS